MKKMELRCCLRLGKTLTFFANDVLETIFHPIINPQGAVVTVKGFSASAASRSPSIVLVDGASAAGHSLHGTLASTQALTPYRFSINGKPKQETSHGFLLQVDARSKYSCVHWADRRAMRGFKRRTHTVGQLTVKIDPVRIDAKHQTTSRQGYTNEVELRPSSLALVKSGNCYNYGTGHRSEQHMLRFRSRPGMAL